MSLIFGVNLSDKIYLSADTRLTIKEKDESLSYKDNTIKIIPFPAPIAVAVAGNVKGGKFILDKLLDLENIEDFNIRTLRDNILDILYPIVDEMLSSGFNYKQSEVCLLFGGLNKESKKKIKGGSWLGNFIKEFQESNKDKTEELMSKLIDEDFKGDKKAIFNYFANDRQTISPVYLEALKKSESDSDGMITTNVSDSHIFAVSISPPKDIKIEDGNFGEFLAYGQKGITKKEIPREVFYQLEFRSSKIGKDKTLLTSAIKKTAKKYKLDKVGGSIFSVIITEKGGGVLTGSVYKKDIDTGEKIIISSVLKDDKDIFYSLDEDGNRQNLIPFIELSESNFPEESSLFL